jgi:hypothetical protein
VIVFAGYSCPVAALHAPANIRAVTEHEINCLLRIITDLLVIVKSELQLE